MALSAEPVVRCGCELGESPRWHAGEQRVYWVDTTRGELWRCAPHADRAERFSVGAAIGACTIEHDGAVALFLAGGAIQRWTERGRQPIAAGIDGEADSRFNDVVADTRGRVLAGTMPAPGRAGRLYRVDLDRSATLLRDDLRLPNGLGFLSSGELVCVDTGRKTVLIADYDAATGTPGPSRVLFRVQPKAGFPDGLAIDEEDGMWIALYGAGAVARFDRGGVETHRVQVPTANVTAACFAGAALDELVITSAATDAGDARLAGALFRVTPGFRGRPPFCSRLG